MVARFVETDGKIQRIDVQFGDRMVITYPRPLSTDQRARLSQAVKVWLDGDQILVLDGGAGLAIIPGDSIDSDRAVETTDPS